LKKGFFYSAIAVLLVTGVALGIRTTSTKTQQTASTTSLGVVATVGTETSTSTTTVYTPQAAATLKQTNYTVESMKVNADSVILFNVAVVEESVEAATSLIRETSGNTVYLVLDSPGGSVLAGARLLEYIKHSGKNVITVCDNLCASMAFQIFEAGSRRLMTEKAILMAHPASGGAQGTIENMFELIKMYKSYVDRMDADVAKRSGIEYSKFKALVADNIWAETPEALALGLADGVVHLDVKSSITSFGNKAPYNVMDILKKTNKWNDKMLGVRGYIFDIR
jgi:ATP-dependent Clp protease protease subunit